MPPGSLTTLPLRAAIAMARRMPVLAQALKSLARRAAGTHHVGAVVVLFNERGEVLLARHALREGWALPGGWIRPHEEPATAVVRELREETGLEVLPGALVGTESHARATVGRGPSGITIAFAGTLVAPPRAASGLSPELREIRWMRPAEATGHLGSFEQLCLAAALAWREYIEPFGPAPLDGSASTRPPAVGAPAHPPEHNAGSTPPG